MRSLIIAALLSATTAAVGEAQDFNWRDRIAAGKRLEIKGVNGGITAEPTTGSQVQVFAKKSARRSDPDEFTIEVIEHAGGVTICAVYPTPRGNRPNTCGPGEEGRMSTRNNDVTVEFTVKVPAGVRFIGRTVNGEITAKRLRADVEAYTVNGSIGVSTRGMARATTVNGSIDAQMGGGFSEPLEFETVNGGITLTVPANSGAELRRFEVLRGVIDLSIAPDNVSILVEARPAAGAADSETSLELRRLADGA